MTKIDKAFAKAFGQATQRKEGAPLLRGPHVPARPAAEPQPAPATVEAKEAKPAEPAPAQVPLAALVVPVAPPAPVVEAKPVVVEKAPVAELKPVAPVRIETPKPVESPKPAAVEPVAIAAPIEEPKAKPAPVVETPVVATAPAVVVPAPAPKAVQTPLESEIAALIARTPVAVAPTAAETLDPKTTLTPQTVIDCFDWSPTEIAICERASDELARLAEHVAPRTAAGLKLLLLTSWARGEGRTSLMCCLGRELARQGLRVAMVDADFARPSMAARLGLSPKHSWTDVLTGDVMLAGVAVESTGDGLVVLPLREASPGSVARFPSGPRLRLVLGLLRRDFDLVLIDGGPLSDGNDPPAGWPQIDAAILVHGPKTLPEDLLKAERQLEAAGVEVLGIAENLQ